MSDEKDSGGTSLTADAAVSVSASDAASHVAPTPGPWRVRTEIGTFGDVVDANDDPVAMAQLRQADAGHYLNRDGQPERQANAHLIAAAPELYEALKRASHLIQLLTVRQVIEGGDDAIAAAGLNPWCMNEGLADGDETISDDFISAAIAKAEGRQS